MKKIFLIALMSFFAHHAIAQVKVGNNPTTIHADAVLDIESTNKGVLLPRMALTATTNPSPLAAHVAGMVIYNTATAGAADSAVVPGIYYNNGSRWFLSSQSAKGATEWRLGADTTVDAEGGKNNIIYREGYVTLGDSLKLDTSAAFSVYKKSSVNPRASITAQKIMAINDDAATTTFQGAEISVYNKIAPATSNTLNGLRVFTKQGITARPGTPGMFIRGIVNDVQGYSGTTFTAAANGSWSSIIGMTTNVNGFANVAGETYGSITGNNISVSGSGTETLSGVYGQNINMSGLSSTSKFPLTRTGLNIQFLPSIAILSDTAKEQNGILSTMKPTVSNKYGYGNVTNLNLVTYMPQTPNKEVKGIYNELNFQGTGTYNASLTGAPMEVIASHNVVDKKYTTAINDIGIMAAQKNDMNLYGSFSPGTQIGGLINSISYLSGNTAQSNFFHFPSITGVNNKLLLTLKYVGPKKVVGLANDVTIVNNLADGGTNLYSQRIDTQYAFYNNYVVEGGISRLANGSGNINEIAGVYSVLENKTLFTNTNANFNIINKYGAYFENKTSGNVGERNITNNYGVKVVNTNDAGATITNSYGLHVSGFGADANAPNSYAVFADGGASYFRDNIAVGVTGTTTEKLEVNGAIKVANSNAATAAEGTIRYNATTKKFQGQIGVGQPGADANGWVDLH